MKIIRRNPTSSSYTLYYYKFVRWGVIREWVCEGTLSHCKAVKKSLHSYSTLCKRGKQK